MADWNVGNRFIVAGVTLGLLGLRDFSVGSISAYRHLLGYDFHRNATTTHHEYRVGMNQFLNAEKFEIIEEWARSKRPIDLDSAQEIADEVRSEALGQNEDEQSRLIKASEAYKNLKVVPDDQDIAAILALITMNRTSAPDSLKKYVELCRAEPNPFTLDIAHHANKSLRSGQSTSDGFSNTSFLWKNLSAYGSLAYTPVDALLNWRKAKND